MPTIALALVNRPPRQTPAVFEFVNNEAQTHLPAVVQALGIDRYVLFGHSVGGGMALTAAAIDGARCVAVVSEAAQAFVEERTLAGIRAAKQSFAAQAQFAKLEKWHGERARWVLEAWTEIWLASEFRQWSLDAILSKVHCPVLVLHGEQDEFGSSAFPQRIVQGVSGPACMKLLPNCGHVPHREQENEVLSLVRDFLHNQAIP